MTTGCEKEEEEFMWSAEDLTGAAARELVAADPERLDGFFTANAAVTICRGRWTMPVMRECGSIGYLMPREDLKMYNFGVLVYDENADNVEMTLLGHDGKPFMSPYTPLFISEYPDVGYLIVSRYADDKSPGYSYSLVMYDYDGEELLSRSLSSLSERLGDFGLGEYNELCVTDNGDIYMMNSEFIARIGYSDGEFSVEKFNWLTALDDFRDRKVATDQFYPDMMRGYLYKLPDGSAALVYRRYTDDETLEWVMRRLSDGDEMLSDAEILPDTGDLAPIIADDGSVWSGDKIGLYSVSYPKNDKSIEPEKTCMMRMTDVGNIVNSYRKLRIGENEEMTACVYDDLDSLPYIAKMTKRQCTDPRTILTLASDSENILKKDYRLLIEVNKFNTTNEEYRIKFTDLRTDEKMTANEKLSRLIRGGKAPDLVVFGGDLVPDDELLVECTFVDFDEALPEVIENYLPAAREPFIMDDELPYLPVKLRFHLTTAEKGKTEKYDISTIKGFDLLIESVDGSSLALASFEDETDAGMTFMTNCLERIAGYYAENSEKTADIAGDIEQLLKLLLKADYPKNDKTVPWALRPDALLTFETAETPVELMLALRGARNRPGKFAPLDLLGGGAAIVEATEAFAIPSGSENQDEALRFVTDYIEYAENIWQDAQNSKYQLLEEFPLTRTAYSRMTDEMSVCAMLVQETPSTDPHTAKTVWNISAALPTIYEDLPVMLTEDEKTTIDDIFFGTRLRKGAYSSLTKLFEAESASCLAGFQTPEKTAKILEKQLPKVMR